LVTIFGGAALASAGDFAAGRRASIVAAELLERAANQQKTAPNQR